MLCRTLIFFCFLLFAFSIKADQNDLRLDRLFEQLLEKNNEIKINEITSNIWEIWYETNDPIIEKDFYHGLEAMRAGDLLKAIALFTRVIEKKPTFAEGWNKRATVYFLIGQFEKSMIDINETLKLEPRHFGAMDGMALIFIQTHQFKRAIDIYDQILKIFPKSKTTEEKKEQLMSIISRST